MKKHLFNDIATEMVQIFQPTPLRGMKPPSHLLPLHCRDHNRTTPTSLTVSLSISCSCAATLASSLRMVNFVPCWQTTKTLDLYRCKHCPQLLLFSCWQPTELFRESHRRGNSLGSRSTARRCPSLLLGGPGTPC